MQHADEPERRDGSPDEKSRFLRHAESTMQKEKILPGKFHLPKSGFAFCSDFLTQLGKRQKKMAGRFLSPPQYSETHF